MESNPADWAAVRKDTTAAGEAPEEDKPIAIGIAPHEHRGVVNPSKDAFKHSQTSCKNDGLFSVKDSKRFIDTVGNFTCCNATVINNPSVSHGALSANFTPVLPRMVLPPTA